MTGFILRAGMLYDGSGAAPRVADIAISDDRIAAIGNDLSNEVGWEEIDVRGLAVAPGFIDSHAHDDYACIADPGLFPKLSQGVTSVIVGNCGLSLVGAKFGDSVPEAFTLLGDAGAFRFPEISDYAAALRRDPPAVNVGTLVGHSSLRARCMADLSRAATESEIAAMGAILERAMQSGALGLSSGLFYAAGAAADVHELSELAGIVARHGGAYASHVRNEYDDIVESLNEAFETARPSAVPLLISHHKCAGVQNWGRSSETLAMIEGANRHHRVACDCYPYDAGSTVIHPELADGKIRIRINSSVPHPEMAGRFLADVAAEWGVTDREAAMRLMPGKASYFQIAEEDMRAILAHPLSMVGSDGLPSDDNPHPRLWGTFPRVLGVYARELGLFDLSEAVAKMTGRTAEFFGLRDRGFLRPGFFADITVFDPQTVIDQATYDDPRRPAAGIVSVFVNGEAAFVDGKATGKRPGKLLERSRTK
jgi:N-acyl-D-amino-acid deacylase